MAAISLKTAQCHLNAWLKAELEVSTSQSYQIGSRMLTRANLKEIREQIKFWEEKVTELDVAQNSRRGRKCVYRAVPRDL